MQALRRFGVVRPGAMVQTGLWVYKCVVMKSGAARRWRREMLRLSMKPPSPSRSGPMLVAPHPVSGTGASALAVPMASPPRSAPGRSRSARPARPDRQGRAGACAVRGAAQRRRRRDRSARAPARSAGPPRASRAAAARRAEGVRARSPFTLEGRAALLHAVAHIEFNAINLALDAVWRFAGMPPAYYRDWLRVAAKRRCTSRCCASTCARSASTTATSTRTTACGRWRERTAHDVTARMALVPRTLEARGLDATPPMQAKLRAAGDARAVEILDVILRDEVGHVAIGNRWYRWLCARDGSRSGGALRRARRAPRRAATAPAVQPRSAPAPPASPTPKSPRS